MIGIEIERANTLPRILVLGVGGGGNNAIDRMVSGGESYSNVTFAYVNTDLMVLEDCNAHEKLQIGRELTGGHGAGADPSVGQSAAEESSEEIENLVSGYQMVVLACGMGGGTGTGATPVIARVCRQQKILTVAVVTLPFSFEGRPKALVASEGVTKLEETVDTLWIIPNEKLLKLSDKKLTIDGAFKLADSVLKYAIFGITNIICNKGTLNLDFNDLRTVLIGKGIGHIGIGTVDGNGSIMDAVKQAIESPLLDTTINGATHILFNTSGEINLSELSEAVAYIQELAGDDANILWGTVKDAQATDDSKIIVTLIAAGMPRKAGYNTVPSIVKRRTPVTPAGRPQPAMLARQVPPSQPRQINPRIASAEIKLPSFLQKQPSEQ